MFKPLRILATAAILAATAGIASAAPANIGQVAGGVSNDIVNVESRDHYRGHWDRSCRRGPHGWYRINRHGERRPCREWRGDGGRRPDACVKAGPIYFCDY